MKSRKWPKIVGAIVVLLLILYAAGAASAYQGESGDGQPLTLVTTWGVAMASAAITALIVRATRLRKATVTTDSRAVQFTISPLEPFTTSIAAARWQLGDGSPLPKFGSFARPLVATDRAGITIWKSDPRDVPLVTIPAATIRSVSSVEQRIQVSRIGVTSRFLCIIVELMIGRTGVTLVLPACTPTNETTPGTPELVEGWAAQMRETIGLDAPAQIGEAQIDPS